MFCMHIRNAVREPLPDIKVSPKPTTPLPFKTTSYPQQKCKRRFSRPDWRRFRLFILVGIALLLVASRIIRLGEIEMDLDEMRSIGRTFGSAEQVIQWTPDDWPPLYYLLLAAWKEIAGLHPIALRMLSVLIALPGYMFMYRLLRRLYGERAGILAALAYGAISYSNFIDTRMRGYALLQMLIPLIFWLATRYFDHPGLKRGLLLGIGIALMFYSTFISGFVFLLLGLYTLVIYRKRIWRWWFPGLIATILCIPEAISKLSVYQAASAVNEEPAPFWEAMNKIYQAHTGQFGILWLILFIIASLLLLYRQPKAPLRFVLGVWVIVLPLAMYFGLDARFLENPRYLFWVIAGAAVLIGWGLSYAPRIGQFSASLLMMVAAFAPITPSTYSVYPYMRNFEQLQQHIQWGDVFIIDPECECPRPEDWDYFIHLYFPDSGLEFSQEPGESRRIWLISSSNNSETKDAVSTGRIRDISIGPRHFRFQLYIAPPDRQGIAFANGMRFHGVDVLDEQLPQSGELYRLQHQLLRLRLWWSVDSPIPMDYSVGTYLMRRDQVVAQVDGSPQLIDPQLPRETSRWQPGRFYIEERTLMMPSLSHERRFQVALAVYQWWDGVKINSEVSDDHGLLWLLNLRGRQS
jgi:hypothetical protein